VHAAFVQPAGREQVLKLAAIRGLGTLPFFVEAFENLAALAAAVLHARGELGRQVQVLRLILRPLLFAVALGKPQAPIIPL
jgi:hypothetical protein